MNHNLPAAIADSLAPFLRHIEHSDTESRLRLEALVEAEARQSAMQAVVIKLQGVASRNQSMIADALKRAKAAGKQVAAETIHFLLSRYEQ